MVIKQCVCAYRAISTDKSIGGSNKDSFKKKKKKLSIGVDTNTHTQRGRERDRLLLETEKKAAGI